MTMPACMMSEGRASYRIGGTATGLPFMSTVVCASTPVVMLHAVEESADADAATTSTKTLVLLLLARVFTFAFDASYP